MSLRAPNLRKLEGSPFDVLIAGGGINGAVAAASLSAGGCSVALVDRGDFGGLTSQESSNLVWGGIKYLENYEFALVRDLCRSRNKLLRNYPSNVREVRFYNAVEPGFRYPPLLLDAGAWLYWAMGGGQTARPRLLTRTRVAREEPILAPQRFAGGVEYSDAYLVENDARFVFSFVRSALNAGAVVTNYVEVVEARRAAGGFWDVRLRDTEGDGEWTARARILVNAAGPWVDALNDQSGIRTRHRHVFSKGIHLIVDRLTREERVLTFFDDTGRLFFVVPMGHRSVIGTTDTPVTDPRTPVMPEDRRFLLDQVNERLALPRPLEERDVIAERCGVRPLVVEKRSEPVETDWLALSRRHEIEVDPDQGHVSVFGGKLTDCLNVGDEVLDAVRKMGAGVLPSERWFGEPPGTVREEFFARAEAVGLDGEVQATWEENDPERLWRRYGLDAFGMLEDVRADPSMADTVMRSAPYLRLEVAHAARAEMVTRLEDFLRRRTKTALLVPREELERDEGVREACRILFGEAAGRRWREYFEGER